MVICEHCGGRKISFGIHINYSGAKTVIARCDKCGRNPDRKKPFYSVKYFDMAALPILLDDRAASEPCAVCHKREGTQYHHWAPRHLFGFDESEKWPGAYLCQEHHTLWHRLVTPLMTMKKGKA
jgi:hypothetical protein